MEEVTFYLCKECGNIVSSVKTGGGVLSCCGREMTKLVPNSTDAAQEKHVPVAVKDGAKIKVTVGSVEHPMTAEHSIQWIALVEDKQIEYAYLNPGMKPKAEFTLRSVENQVIYTGENDEIVPNCEGQPCNFVYTEKSHAKITVYAYCNLHGLWKTEI